MNIYAKSFFKGDFTMGELLDKAILFAANAHRGQKRKIFNTPFILHPLEAAAIAAMFTNDEEVLASAVLHDVLEDTDTDAETIRREFGERVFALVAHDTEDKQRDRKASDSWADRKKASLEKMARLGDNDVKYIWIGDKLSNMRSFYRAYLEHGNRIWEFTNQKDAKMQEWYYRSILEILRPDFRDSAAWKELSFLIDKVFENQ